MMEIAAISIGTFVVGEGVAFLVFRSLNMKFSGLAKKTDKWSIAKGFLERIVLLTGLLTGFPQVLILFGALKIGTRIKNEHPVSNDYYFVGNMVSVLFVLVYFIIIKVLTSLV